MKPTSFSVVLLTVTVAQCAKILGIFPMAARSHYILGSAIMRELANRGHDVTVVSSFGESKAPENGSYRDIVLTGFVEKHNEKMKEFNMFEKKRFGPMITIPFLNKMMVEMNDNILKHTNVQPLFRPEEKFDVVIIEEFMLHSVKAFATHFNAPLISLSTMGANSWINNLVGNPTPVAYAPDILVPYSTDKTFFQRLHAAVLYIYQEAVCHLFVYSKHNQLIEKYFSHQPPHIYEVLYNVSLVLLNSHESVNAAVPYVPNMIDIGGFHVKPPQPLPEDLQHFLDSAKDGVIYFSLGSNIKGSLLPPEKRQVFLDTFSKLKEKVLWKWEEDILPGQPDNVKLGKWFPQQDILAHPNVKLFITHAGLLSTIETIYHGMPVLAIPIGGDQAMNAQQIVNKGIGLALSFHDLTEETLTQKLEELLNDKAYRNNAKKRSELFHDRLVPPMDTAMYWIEYVLRHGGANHLRVAALDLPWYKYFLLDVVAFLLLVTAATFCIVFTIVKFVFSKKGKRSKAKLL